MPTCPKCGKFISEGKYVRHIKRCGTTHKHRSTPLSPGQDTFFTRI